jgi:cobalt-zinc-cadmium efflux system membrane fusion protein
MLDVRQEDVGHVKKKQRITFRVDGDSAVEASGTVSWISTEVDDKTRMVRVRAEVDNNQGQLRARSFGTGRILICERPDAITVPSEALQWNGSEALLFVCQADGLSFEPHTVCVGIQNGNYTQVIDGVQPGEIVATSGSHVLRSQLFRSQIGGGD